MRRAARRHAGSVRNRRKGVAAVLALLLGAEGAWSATEQAVRCEFGSGLRAIYLIAPASARVRRADVRPVRQGRLEAAPGEYRLVFDTDADLRSVTVIDRDTGAARRVFGHRERMQASFARAGPGDGLVREAGTCRTRFGELG